MASRSPIQVGAELYGDGSVRADIEVISLMLASLQSLNIDKLTLDLGHVAFYRELLSAAGLDADQESQLFQLMQEKNLSDLPAWLQENVADVTQREALLQLAQLNGGKAVLEQAKAVCAGNANLEDALQQLEAVVAVVEQRFPDVAIYLDLSELRGYHYHTGLVFAAFCEDSGRAIANGGRYDHIGEVFGRARPATGFNADLKTLMSAADEIELVEPEAILAPADEDPGLWHAISTLRTAGEVVVQDLDGQQTNYSRRLVKTASGNWEIQSV
jgi:ATP phosphoribosyltransferase regulatory subunit